ncbi:hypothetical protein [Psychrobacillus psychrotolerans]|uniref:hypothetical protein n=2 Tax=Psychrobacillus TaxID=1221880 RepID=UPI003315B3E4
MLVWCVEVRQMIIIFFLKNILFIVFIVFIVFLILALIELIKVCIWLNKKKEKMIRADEYYLNSFRLYRYFAIMSLSGFLLEILKSIL